ncbi:hypothetical protein AJ85_08670 [Alkalihalobacillus alcalophilus ATCC 27647 = CGMCC 1.3604]|uniref:GmrSD restriction endonucleases N-terminal domain-containing protein n=1 Tax=Alkalihalobacillus alcalophilus ATCC 27647 = CGMCC 1.3604 TaxID=1218173 RepID=A0A094WHR1_ALKAL|nr:DUF262 domain-containing protein [Alkalihalobacillus alcalophilus]KGA96341.1 hypothetical protein BALCAV_0216900 [Alkalihalobacillus alcalophilus ATCC 27647 = CGMCC 1.3604]MED1560751.1 DUF262 domain-containing protein [Alkalihalobacillus alcalophilus]THG90807.1 hypothetical protein AJ85_08670 [Alkalihalobacillus alcalophilus ATCC 27647 = CGMCC 1.3604]
MILKNFHILKVKDVYDKFTNGVLVVDESYQRRKVWNETDKIRLIETILIGYIVPSLYLWDAEIDPTTGQTITHIVDGQQRVNAIVDFIEGKFSLLKSSLTQPDITGNYANKRFDELTEKERVNIWSYNIPVVQLSEVDNVETIKSIFYRLNLTDYNLRAQEKRHSTSNGLFAELAIELSENEFWSNHNLFNAGDIKRMKDIEFCASLILLARDGIINQTTQRPLNNAYDDYKDIYEERDIDKMRILFWIDSLNKFINDTTIGFIQKKSQLYTMFTVIDYLESNKIEISDEMVLNFTEFVKMYLDYRNDNVDNDDSTKIILNTYKLAVSEGINKLKNRMIRFNIMKKVLLQGINSIDEI